MIPRSWPTRSDTGEPSKVVVFELTSTTGLKAWTDYIPAAVKALPTAANRLKYNDDGYMGFHILADVTGLVAWRDYIPIDTVAYVAANAWRVNASGFIPYVDETA